MEKFQNIFGVGDVVLLIICCLLGYYYLIFKKNKSLKIIPKTSFSLIPTQTTDMDSTTTIQRYISGGKNFFVFFGSQTGTAESFANRLVQDARKYSLKSIAIDPEECEIEDIAEIVKIPNHIVVFVIATYGEGDPTDNARDLYEWLEGTPEDLKGLNFAVFGLGNKTYEHYNAMGKFFDKKLGECNSERILPLGMGNDDACIEEDFVGWKEKFWETLEKKFGIQPKLIDGSNRQYGLKTFKSGEIPNDKVFKGEYARLGSYRNQKIPFDSKNPFLSRILVNRNLYHGGDRICMHIELDISESRLKYEPGDHVAIYPANDSSVVQEIGKLLQIDLDQIFSLVNLDEESTKKHPFPCPCSYRTALTYYLDISSPLRTNVLKDLAKFATSKTEQDELLTMSQYTPEGKAMYADKVVGLHLDLLSLLQTYPSLKPPLDFICELLPRLQQRYYSISSSQKVYPDSIHITAVVTKWKTRTGKIVNGVATTWLVKKIPMDKFPEGIDKVSNGPPDINKCANDKIGDEERMISNDYTVNDIRVPIYVRRSQFKLPLKKNIPIIMIGPGTGFAPYRGFLQHRKYFRDEGKPMGNNVLFYGCRNKNVDYLYKEEIENYVKDKVISDLFVAYSRDQPEKIYVTHLLKDARKLIWDLLDKQLAHLYICGDAKNMAKDVNNILLNIFETEGPMSAKEAETYIKNLHNKSRYQSDVWS